MLAAAQAGLEVVAYSPLSIKSAVVGYGKAEKSQVQIMVARLLSLPAPPHPTDAADALAIAICHLHTAGTLQRQAAGQFENREACLSRTAGNRRVRIPRRAKTGLFGITN